MKHFTVYNPETGEIAYFGASDGDQPVPDGMAIIYVASNDGQRVNIDDPEKPFIEDIPANRRRQPQPPDDNPAKRPYPSREEFQAVLDRLDMIEIYITENSVTPPNVKGGK